MKKGKLHLSTRHGIIVALLVLVVIFSVTTDGVFISARNISNLSRQIVLYGIMGMGMTMILIMGGIDLSVGSLVGLGGMLSAMFTTKYGLPDPIAVIITVILGGMLPGFIIGFLSEKFRFNPFITSLGLMGIAQGVSLTISAAAVPVGTGIRFLGKHNLSYTLTFLFLLLLGVLVIYFSVKKLIQSNSTHRVKDMLTLVMLLLILSLFGYIFLSYKGIPLMFLIFVGVALATNFLLRKTVLGRHMYAIGGNNKAARLSGVPVMKSWITGFMLSGTAASFCGVLLAGRLGAAAPTAGSGFELNVIAACVIGGTSLSGGVGTVSGTIIGVTLLGVLSNGMSLWNLSSYIQMIVTGSIVIIAVIIDSISKKKALR